VTDESLRMLYLGVDHPAISCHDVNGQVDWYCRNLGLKVVFNDGKTPPSVLVGYDGQMAAIELMPVRHAGPNPAETPRYQPGLRHLALRVSNFDEAYRKLKEQGVKFITEPMPSVGGGKTAFFHDPEGNELQIVERNGKAK
jgi:catechol 2,3-dioxygenase-like lactoylglutathione lyase family enzyme